MILMELEQEQLLKQLQEQLTLHPLFAGDLLQLVAKHQSEYHKALERRRSVEAHLAISDLIVWFMNRRGFGGMPRQNQANFMNRVIAYQFPNGSPGPGHLKAEIEFYKRFKQE